SFCYDGSNRLTSTTDPALKTTAYEYNARSQMTAVVDAINQRYEFVYDPLGRVTQNKKGTATMSFIYDAAGNRSQRTDYNSAVTNYSYDPLNRLTTISYPDTTSATYGYDVLSRLTTATNPNGTVTLAYDNRSRVSSVTDVFGQVVGYVYDANSNRTQLSLNGGTSATYQYDVLSRLTQLADAASLNTTFGYDATNKLTARNLPNGVATSYQYDGLDRLTRLTHSKAGNTLADFQYQFNTVSNITQMTDGAGAHNYTYDTRDRLTAATHPNQTNESYTLDDVGNRTASHQGSSYTYQAFNRLVTANGASFGYDLNGSLTSKTDASGSWTYTWDYESRLIQASKSGGATVTYAYDALGRRVQRTSSTSGTTEFVYDGADVLRDLDGSGATIADYLNGPGIDNKLRQTISGTASYFLADRLGTTRALTDTSGNIASSLGYDSFGNVISGSASTRYTYIGREGDSYTGLNYYRARWYDSDLGRFISEDPIGFAGGINLYAYVANDPIRFTDPSGHQIRSDRNWNEGDENPITHKTLHSDFKQLAGMGCALDGFNPWLSAEAGGGFHWLAGGGNAAVGTKFNLFTMEICFYVRTCARAGFGIYAGGGGNLGFSFGPSEGERSRGLSAQLAADAAVPGEGGRLLGRGSSGSFGPGSLGIGAGPTLGGGFSVGTDICHTRLVCYGSPKCSCNQ
ncbi:MAG: RHS repeat-associated core domain-containing protein, partial [Pyrinomonadaceae bacterium]